MEAGRDGEISEIVHPGLLTWIEVIVGLVRELLFRISILIVMLLPVTQYPDPKGSNILCKFDGRKGFPEELVTVALQVVCELTNIVEGEKESSTNKYWDIYAEVISEENNTG